MRNDARSQNDINGPVTHGLICDVDLAADRVSRGRQYEITHWPALCLYNPRRPLGKERQSTITANWFAKPWLAHPSSSLSWDWSREHSEILNWNIDPMSACGSIRPCSCPASKRNWQGAPKTRSTPCLR